MVKDEINKKLDNIFENKKGRNFMNHLIRAYFPQSNVDKVFIKPKDKFKCVITNENLISVNTILNDIKDESIKDELFKYLHNMFNSDVEVDSLINKLINGRNIGIQGSNTDTFMSINTYIGFYDWVLAKFITGDKHISWLLKGVNKNDFMGKAENLQDNEVQKVIKKKQRKEDGNRATFSLGDLTALQELKNKMEGK